MAKTAARNRKPVLRKKAAPAGRKVPARAAAPPKRARPISATRKVAPVKSARGKWVYSFGDGRAEGKARLRDLLGGKGANLAEMANLGLPVPPGFTITTEVCTYFYGHDQTYPGELKAQVKAALDHVGKIAGKTFGDPTDPLLVSVRSGARASMPGMMDTVLNLGLNDATVAALAKKSGDARFA
jgi:pyruvate, orthophosphate dikinase